MPRKSAEVVFDYLEMWHLMSFYHRGENPESRRVRLKGYVTLQSPRIDSSKARLRLERFIAAEEAKHAG